jgi:hypothetical protein
MPSFDSGFESRNTSGSSKAFHRLAANAGSCAALYQFPRRQRTEDWRAASDILLRFNEFPWETKALQFSLQLGDRFLRSFFRSFFRNPGAAGCVSTSE